MAVFKLLRRATKKDQVTQAIKRHLDCIAFSILADIQVLEKVVGASIPEVSPSYHTRLDRRIAGHQRSTSNTTNGLQEG